MDSLANPPSPVADRDRPGAVGPRALLREPLVHFLLLGGIVFAISVISARTVERARVVEIPPDQVASIQDRAKASLGRAATEQELTLAFNDWLTGEVLYREALALGLDKNDPGIRARLVTKMRAVLDQQVDPGKPTEAQARAWFDANHAKFDVPASVDFIGVRFEGAGAEARARAALAQIQAGAEPESLRDLARIYRSRAQTTIDDAFGKGFLGELLAAKREAWTIVHSPGATDPGMPRAEAWYIVRVDGVTEAKPADWTRYHDAAVEGWRQDEAKRQAAGMMKVLRSRYVIRWPGR